MNLEEFAENLKEDIENFIKVWEAGVEDTPEHFPEKIALNDWYEQWNGGLYE